MADFSIVDELVFPSHNEVAPVGSEDDASDLAEQTTAQLIKGISKSRDYVESGFTVPSSSASLNIDVALGVAFISGLRVDVPGATTITASPSTTNHVYLKFTRDGNGDVDEALFEVNTTGTPPADSIKIATLVAGVGTITSTTDARNLTAVEFKKTRLLIFTASGVLPVPTDVSAVTVVMLGAGGGGGGAGEAGDITNNGNAGSAGGAGGDTWLVNSGNNARGGNAGAAGGAGLLGGTGAGGAAGAAAAAIVPSFAAAKYSRGSAAGVAGSPGATHTSGPAAGGPGTAITALQFDKFNGGSNGAGGGAGAGAGANGLPGGNGSANYGTAAGGGGGGTSATGGGGGGGGGSPGTLGEFVEMEVTVTPGASETVTIGAGGSSGAGGAGGAPGGGDGGAGGIGGAGLMFIFY